MSIEYRRLLISKINIMGQINKRTYDKLLTFCLKETGGLVKGKEGK
jgi:hypothetical protein